MKEEKKLMTPEEKLLYYFNVPDYKKKLVPVIDIFKEEPMMISFLLNMKEEGNVSINIYGVTHVIVDHKKPKFDKRGLIELSLTEGLHIVRLIVDKNAGGIIRDGLQGYDTWPAVNSSKCTCDANSYKCTCEAMYISDSITIKSKDSLSKALHDFKRIIFGKSCDLNSTIARWKNIGEITVVDDNKYLYNKDGCIISRTSKNLIYAKSDVEVVPAEISEINDYSLMNCNGKRLVFPGTLKKVSIYDLETGRLDTEPQERDHSNIKELIFEEGIEDIRLNHFIFPDDMIIKFPESLKSLDFFGSKLGKVQIPANVATINCCDSTISELEIEGDISLECKYHDAFQNFSGNVKFGGNIFMPQQVVRGIAGVSSSFGAAKDDCTITVKSQELADAIKNSKSFNNNVKVSVA